jgi:hypothetical protein
MKRKTLTLLSLVPLTALALWLDALEPGQGRFYNPMFWARSQFSKLDTAWRERQAFDVANPLLQPCQSLTSENTLSAAQEQARAVITGQSEAFTLSQLGAPTCALAGNTYRWLTQSGLAVDVTFENGTVKDAKLNR